MTRRLFYVRLQSLFGIGLKYNNAYSTFLVLPSYKVVSFDVRLCWKKPCEIVVGFLNLLKHIFDIHEGFLQNIAHC